MVGRGEVLVDYVWQTLPLYLPLGLIGLWRWSVWLIKKGIGRAYTPDQGDYTASVSVITPVYNENPTLFRQALESWDANNVDEIIAVIDHSDTACIEVFRTFAQTRPHAQLIVTEKPGKRPALADGIVAARSDIVALVDSDTLWDSGVKAAILPPFRDPQVGGVATRQSVMNPQTIAQRAFAIQLDQRYLEEYPFLMAFNGSVLTCLSGRTAVYRREILLPLLDKLVNETFWGKKVISGEDKRLTYLVEAAGWKVRYQQNARVFTTGNPTMRAFLKQRLRWSRNTWRADLRALTQPWIWRHVDFVLYELDRMIQPFAQILSPLFFMVALVFQLWIPAAIILTWWMVSRAIRLYPYMRRSTDGFFFIPVYTFITFYSAFLKIYALLTMNQQGWITRWHSHRLSSATLIPRALATAGMATLVIGMTWGVFVYKEKTLGDIFGIPNTEAYEYKILVPTDKNNGPRVLSEQDRVTPSRPVPPLARYVIQSEDNLWSVAAKLHIPVENIFAVNRHLVPSSATMVPGQVITIPLETVKPQTLDRFRFDYKEKGPLIIAYHPDTNTITVSGRGNIITLRDIARAVPSAVQETQPGEWLLTANIEIKSGVSLHLVQADVTWLKLQSNHDTYVSIRSDNGYILIDGVKITSWDTARHDVDTDQSDGRSYIVTAQNSRMDIYNAELAYLGYAPRPEGPGTTFGVAWRTPDGKTDQYIATGEVIQSYFHDNYYGAYTFGAYGMVWRDNRFENNTKYGLDLYGSTHEVLVENNRIESNGSHGLVVASGSYGNTVRNNRIVHNSGHGIIVYNSANDNQLQDNIVWENNHGIVVHNSNNNTLKGNTISKNAVGIRLSNEARGNRVENNIVTKNTTYAVFLSEGATNNTIDHNELRTSAIALALYNSDKNSCYSNTIEFNDSGVLIRGQSYDNYLATNRIMRNDKYGMFVKTKRQVKNYVHANYLANNAINVGERTSLIDAGSSPR